MWVRVRLRRLCLSTPQSQLWSWGIPWGRPLLWTREWSEHVGLLNLCSALTLRGSLLTKVFPKARLLKATKRWSHVRFVVGVDEYCTSLQPLAHKHSLVDVAREHAWGQAVLCVIGSLQHTVHIAVVWTKRTEDKVSGLTSMTALRQDLLFMTYPSLNFDTTMTGPKDSSFAMNMWSSTSVNTVGSIK